MRENRVDVSVQTCFVTLWHGGLLLDLTSSNIRLKIILIVYLLYI